MSTSIMSIDLKRGWQELGFGEEHLPPLPSGFDIDDDSIVEMTPDQECRGSNSSAEWERFDR